MYAGSSREKKVTDKDFNGKDLWELIKNRFFSGYRTHGYHFGSKELRFIFAKAYAKGKILSSRDFQRKNYQTKEEFDDALDTRANEKVLVEGEFYDNQRSNIGKAIKINCNGDSLPKEGWGGDVYDMLLTSIYYDRIGRILKFYKYDLHKGCPYQFRTEYEYQNPRGQKKLTNEEPYLNIFYKFNGIDHYDALKRKPETRDQDLTNLLNTKNTGSDGWKKYFSVVDTNKKGLCYFDAIPKAVRAALELEKEQKRKDFQEFPEGGGFHAQSSLGKNSAIDLTGDSPIPKKSRKRKQLTFERDDSKIVSLLNSSSDEGEEEKENKTSSDEELLVLPRDSDDDEVQYVTKEENQKMLKKKKENEDRKKRADAAEKRWFKKSRGRFLNVLKF